MKVNVSFVYLRFIYYKRVKFFEDRLTNRLSVLRTLKL